MCLHFIRKLTRIFYHLHSKMRISFRTFSDLFFTNPIQKSRLFSLAQKEPSAKNYKIDLLFCGNPIRQSYAPSKFFRPVANISYGFLTLYVSYLSVKLLLGFCNEMAYFMAINAKRFSHTFHERFPLVGGLISKMSVTFGKAKSYISFILHPPDNLPDPLPFKTTTFVAKQEETDSSAKCESSPSINSLFYAHIPSITGRLLALGKPKTVQHISTLFQATHNNVHNFHFNPLHVPSNSVENLRNNTPTPSQSPQQTGSTSPTPTSNPMQSVMSCVETSANTTLSSLIQHNIPKPDSNPAHIGSNILCILKYDEALAHFKGHIVTKNKDLGMKLFGVAAQSGHKKSIEIISRLEKIDSYYFYIPNCINQ